MQDLVHPIILQFQEFGGSGGGGNFYEIQVFFSGTDSAVADVFVDDFGMDAVFELVGDKSMAQIVDFDIFETGFFEIAVDAGSNVSDEEWPTGLGDEEVGIFSLGANG